MVLIFPSDIQHLHPNQKSPTNETIGGAGGTLAP